MKRGTDVRPTKAARTLSAMPYSVIPRSVAAAVHLDPEANPGQCSCCHGLHSCLFILGLALLSVL